MASVNCGTPNLSISLSLPSSPLRIPSPHFLLLDPPPTHTHTHKHLSPTLSFLTLHRNSEIPIQPQPRVQSQKWDATVQSTTLSSIFSPFLSLFLIWVMIIKKLENYKHFKKLTIWIVKMEKKWGCKQKDNIIKNFRN